MCDLLPDDYSSPFNLIWKLKPEIQTMEKDVTK